jgi:hypothetical protein
MSIALDSCERKADVLVVATVAYWLRAGRITLLGEGAVAPPAAPHDPGAVQVGLPPA